MPRLCSQRQCEVRDHKPRSEFRGMWRSSALVIWQSLLEIARQTDVSLVRHGFRLQNVDVIHNSKISNWLASRSLDAIGRPRRRHGYGALVPAFDLRFAPNEGWSG